MILKIKGVLDQMGVDTSQMTDAQIFQIAASDPMIAAQAQVFSFDPAQNRSFNVGDALAPLSQPEDVQNPFNGGVAEAEFALASPDFDALRARRMRDDSDKLNQFLQGAAQGALAGLIPGEGGVGSVLAGAGAGGMGALLAGKERETQALENLDLLESQYKIQGLQFTREELGRAVQIDMFNNQQQLQFLQMDQQQKQYAAQMALQLGMYAVETPYGTRTMEFDPTTGQVEEQFDPDFNRIYRMMEEDRLRRSLAMGQLMDEQDFFWDPMESKIPLAMVASGGPEAVLRMTASQAILRNQSELSRGLKEMAVQNQPQAWRDQLERWTNSSATGAPERVKELEIEAVMQFISETPIEDLASVFPEKEWAQIQRGASYNYQQGLTALQLMGMADQ
jgi:hypothetical protein